MAMETHSAAVVEEEGQLVVFELAGESYGVDIAAVNTIIRMQPITHVPRSPHYIEGVINLRGSIIPVLDLRKRFGLSEGELTKTSRIMVVEADGTTIGMIVDAVTETLKLSNDAIEPPSPITTTADSEYVQGVGKTDNRLIVLLRIDKILSKEEIGAISNLAA